MMRIRFSAILFALPLVLSGCAGTTVRQADWINGDSSHYPAAKYLTGRGQAEYQAAARDRARADLAKIFEVSISAQSKDIVSYSGKREGDARSTQLESGASRNISTSTRQIISGIRIAETWRNPETGQFYALAVLDRIKAAGSLRQNINRLDDITAQSIRDARRNPDLIGRIGQASRAVQAQMERSAYQKQLQVVDYTGAGLRSPYNIATLIGDKEALFRRLRIQASVASDPLGGLATALTGALSSAGFTHATGDRPDYVLTGRLRLHETDAQGWYWQRGTLEIALVQLPGHRMRGSKRWNIKTSAQDRKTAISRARNQIDDILKKELRQTIIGFGAP